MSESRRHGEPERQDDGDPALARYARQVRFAPFGEEGQRKLLTSRVLVCGVGALGSVIANTLARAGVGKLRLVDRDFVELNNLQRQVLFDERDVAANMPKAVAAAEKLRVINSEIEIEPIVADVGPDNIVKLCEGVDLILDGTDNFETRFLINDAAVKLGIPWVYGGCIGAEGQTLTILPRETPCLRCVMAEPPPPGTSPTCDTAGILSPIINVVASIEAQEGMKILAGKREAVQRHLLIFDLWENAVRQVKLDGLRDAADCQTCKHGDYPWLSGERAGRTAVLCGRNAVQISAPAGQKVSLDALAEKLAVVGKVSRNPFLLRAAIGDYLLTVFPDGRAIIGGTDEEAVARSIYAKYIGM
ncbi:MAG: ThiF family adenylyltransferase [Planctomycetaceae bacterium]|nr:ThiF family adenylyltransferase [Planctomycetaceae bacterium]